jgi:hypothetical protein
VTPGKSSVIISERIGDGPVVCHPYQQAQASETAEFELVITGRDERA